MWKNETNTNWIIISDAEYDHLKKVKRFSPVPALMIFLGSNALLFVESRFDFIGKGAVYHSSKTTQEFLHTLPFQMVFTFTIALFFYLYQVFVKRYYADTLICITCDFSFKNNGETTCPKCGEKCYDLKRVQWGPAQMKNSNKNP